MSINNGTSFRQPSRQPSRQMSRQMSMSRYEPEYNNNTRNYTTPERSPIKYNNEVNEFNRNNITNPWENIEGNNRNTAYVYRNIYDPTSISSVRPQPVLNKNGTVNLNATYKKYSHSPEKLSYLHYYGLVVKDGKLEKISSNNAAPNHNPIFFNRWDNRHGYYPGSFNKKISTQRKLKLSNVEKEPLIRQKEKNNLLKEIEKLIEKKQELVRESESINKKIKNIENKLTKL
jgi:hypothetical protein